MNIEQIQYVSNNQGKPTAVIVPIELWQEMISDSLESEAMKQHLLTELNNFLSLSKNKFV